MTPPHLKLTVYTIASQSASQCLMVVRELQRQTIREHIEVIVVTPNRNGLDESEFAVFGAWQWLLLPEVKTCGAAMAAATLAARAPYVTYAEEHSHLDEKWGENLVAAHGRGYEAVGFAMENANPENLVSWAHLYGQFGSVVAPVESGEIDLLGGHHISYCREMLLGYGDMMDAMLEDESALCLDLRARGKKLFIAGDAISFHANLSSLTAYMRLDFYGQRSFADARAKIGKWSFFKRALYAGAVLLFPVVRMRRILRHINRTGRSKEMLPQILVPISLALAAGACGEMLGYIVGGGKSAEGKSPMEFQRENYLASNDNWTNSQVQDSVS